MRKIYFCSALVLLTLSTMAARESSRIEPIEGYTQQTTVPLIESLTRKHTDTVTTIAPIPGTDNFFSSGKDGFVSYIPSDGLQQIWQISEIPKKTRSRFLR